MATEAELLASLATLQLDEQRDEAAALYTELGALAQSPQRQAAYLQKAYALRLHSVAAAVIQQGGGAAGGSSQEPAGAAADGDGTASTSSSSSDAEGAWDASDDWEPDVSQLRKASSFERRRTQPAVALQAFASQPHHAAPPASGGSRNALSEPGRADSASSWRNGSCGGGGASRPRGRGQSKLGLPSTDSEDEALQLAGQQQLPHIVEVHGLSRAVSTNTLETFLLDYLWGGTSANIKWVDEEHALAVFPCPEAAQMLLEAPQRQYAVRPYSKASRAARCIPAEELPPPRGARPKTTTAVARRLISNALGNREVRDRAAEKELAELRRANKQERQQRQQGLNEAWGDDE